MLDLAQVLNAPFPENYFEKLGKSEIEIWFEESGVVIVLLFIVVLVAVTIYQQKKNS